MKIIQINNKIIMEFVDDIKLYFLSTNAIEIYILVKIEMRELQAICKNTLPIPVIKVGLHFKLHYHNAAYILRGFKMKNFDNINY